jgi:hypothetical protein
MPVLAAFPQAEVTSLFALGYSEYEMLVLGQLATS